MWAIARILDRLRASAGIDLVDACHQYPHVLIEHGDLIMNPTYIQAIQQINQIETQKQQMEQQLDEVKAQLKIISQSTTKIEEIESRFQIQVNHELEEIKKQLTIIAESKLKIEGEISDKWNLLVKLRSRSYDQLMSEYTKVEEKLLIERRETNKIDVNEQPKE